MIRLPVVIASGDQLAHVEAELTKRWPESSVTPSLDRIRKLTGLMGDPQHAFPGVHVAGTNGKTTTTRLVDALLRELGLRTGRYTSPHLESVTERICLDGDPLSPEAFVAAYEEMAPLLPLADEASGRTLSFFEVLTAMAFAVFADAPVDAAVVEVGLGGRFDATNVFDGQVAVVTPVDFDHMHLLGSTIAEIAAEKAGIIKSEAAAVIGPQLPEAQEVLLARVAEVGARPYRFGADFGLRARSVAVGGQLISVSGLAGNYDDLFLPLHGAHQAVNAACAVAGVEAFLGGRGLDVVAVREALAGASSPGRLEIVRRSPTVLLDAAHNPAGARALAGALAEAFSFRRLIAVLAVLADKDVTGLLRALQPAVDLVVATASSSPRALPPDTLAALAEEVFGAGRVRTAATLEEALTEALRLADEDLSLQVGTGVLVTGSVVTVGEARALLRPPPASRQATG
ncbi:MAG: bifunctional folylpolyglutamate synthase/dihydrofolate synthase [Mycobacteriales bacterium]